MHVRRAPTRLGLLLRVKMISADEVHMCGTGNTASDDRETARLPVSESIIVPEDTMIISPQRAMVGGINHPQQLRSLREGELMLKTVTSQVRSRTFIYTLVPMFC